MASRPTIADVARESGVSVATVDRVLNARAKVREDTARRVYEAAQKIGYHAAGLIAQRLQADLPEIRFGFVFHKEDHAFYMALKEALVEAVQNANQFRGRIVMRFASGQQPSEFASLMSEMKGKVDVLAATAVAANPVTEAVEDLQAAGIPCFALLNDFAQGVRQHYVGLNNLKAGRIAGHILAETRHRPGKMAIFVGGHRWHGHELRETGFRSYIREHAPRFEVLETMVNLETRRLTYEATLELLDRHKDVRGIYCAGGGMEGAIQAMREARATDEVGLVVSELTPESRAALADRFVTMVIGTPLPQLCADTVSLMARAVSEPDMELHGQHFLQPMLYTPEAI